MRRRKLGRTGMEVSVLSLGTMTFGWGADEPASFAIMSEALARGINLFDTADVYSRWAANSYAGKTEEIMGRWFAQDGARRDRVLLASKVRGQMSDDAKDQGLGYQRIISSVEGSLRRLQTDYLDLYQSHYPDDEVAQEQTMRAFDELVRSGKVRAVGCSNFSAWKLMESLWTSDKHGLARYESLQPHYNLLNRREFEEQLKDVCLKYEIGAIPYSPLAGGFLTGKYRRGQGAPAGSRGAEGGRILQHMAKERNFDLLERLEQLAQQRGATTAQVALAWAIDAPAITSPIIGATTVAQLQELLPAAELTLSAEERDELDKLSEWKE